MDPDPLRRDWRALLRFLPARHQPRIQPSAWQAAGMAAVEIHWALVAEMLEIGQAAVRPLLRERRAKDGQLGTPRPVRIADVLQRSLDDADRRMLSRQHLLPGQPEAFLASQKRQVTAQRDDLVGLARAGRLRLDSSDTPLAWDERPWTVHATCVPSESGQSFEIAFRLVGSADGATSSCAPREVLAVLDEGLLLFSDRLASFEGDADPALLRQLRRADRIELPAEELEEFVIATTRLLGSTPIDGVETAPSTPPQPGIDLDAPDPRQPTIACRVWFDYDGTVVDPADTDPLVLADDGTAIRRDPEAEQQALHAFRDLGGWYEARMVSSGPRILRDRFLDVVRSLREHGWSVRATGKPVHSGETASLQLSTGIDWFSVDGSVAFGERELALPALLARLDRNRSMVLLDDGSLGMLPAHWLRGWLRALEHGEVVDGERLRFPAAQGLWLDALLEEREGLALERDDATVQRRKELERFRRVKPAKAPRSFRGELRPYQQQGLGWLRFLDRFGFGGCLADDMGLGKTVQLLALLEGRRNAKDREGPALVVAPKSVVGNWCAEAARFTPKLRVLDWSGGDRWRAHGAPALDAADLVVTTYGVLRRDAPRWLERRFDHAILDEAQAIKNPQSQTAKAARLLNARRRLALTGTPVENHLGELWSLFQFLEPGMLGTRQRFQELLDEDRDGQDPVGDRLRRTLRPFLLRRTKEAVLDDLPEKTEQVLHCKLTGKQAKEYERARQFFEATLGERLDADGVQQVRFHVLEALLRLRQLACHVGLVEKEQAGVASAKFDTLLPMLEEVVEGGHKALVFSQFTSLLGLLKSELADKGLDHLYLDGKTRKRAALVKRFQEESDPKLFLISLKAGGSGLNLTAADYVFVLDPWWNPAVEAQAIDRAHRIGQTRKVMAYRVIAEGTIEDRVLELQARKRELTKALFEQKKGPLSALTREDIEFLFAKHRA